MNRGNIPGFYYDEEKKKYFKIQPDRLAPPDAKYARSHVRHEEQESRKRKREEKHERLILKQTVPASRLWKHPLLGGTGLRREQGDETYASLDNQREIAFLRALQPSKIVTDYPQGAISLADAVSIPQHSSMVFAVAHSTSSHSITPGKVTMGEAFPLGLSPGHALYAFHNPVTHLNCRENNGTPIVVACASQPCAGSGNIFIGPATQAWSQASTALNTYPNTIWDCKVNGTELVALAGEHGAEIISASAERRRVAQCASVDGSEAFACEWLNEKTLALGTRRLYKKTASHNVLLWDIRSGGAATRFSRDLTITGIHKASDQHLCVSSNYTIDQYDLRVLRKDRPLFSMPHQSPSKQLHMSTYDHLLACTGVANKVEVYSLRTGRHLRTLAPSEKTKGLLMKPRWFEDESTGAPYLQACLGNSLWRWSWAGKEADADTSMQ